MPDLDDRIRPAVAGGDVLAVALPARSRPGSRGRRPVAIAAAGAVAIGTAWVAVPRLAAVGPPRPHRLFLLDEDAQATWNACRAAYRRRAVAAGVTSDVRLWYAGWDECFAKVGYEPPDTTIARSGFHP